MVACLSRPPLAMIRGSLGSRKQVDNHVKSALLEFLTWSETDNDLASALTQLRTWQAQNVLLFRARQFFCRRAGDAVPRLPNFAAYTVPARFKQPFFFPPKRFYAFHHPLIPSRLKFISIPPIFNPPNPPILTTFFTPISHTYTVGIRTWEVRSVLCIPLSRTCPLIIHT